MDIRQLGKKLKILEDANIRLKDIEEIKKLQRIYGYYVERGQLDEVAELFSDSPEVSINMSGMVMTGKENVKKTFSSKKPFGVMQGPIPNDYLHITMPVSGVVDIDTDGKTAKARWYALMYLHNAGMGGGAVLGVGIYENGYIKENGKWKVLHLHFDDIILTPYEDGWAKTPKIRVKLQDKMPPDFLNQLAPEQSKSPFGDQVPFHYKHPITGKEVKKR